jgi:nucleotide-binding universal stress UspA family protein
MNKTLKKVLCPIDFTEKSLHALRAAYALALCFSANLIAVYVMPGPNAFRLPANRPAHHRIMDAYFSEQLDLTVRQWTSGNVPVESMLLEGFAADEIVRVADRLHVDAIVMADEQMTDWERVRDGSTLDEVAIQAPCPVYVLRDVDGEVNSEGDGIIRLS